MEPFRDLHSPWCFMPVREFNMAPKVSCLQAGQDFPKCLLAEVVVNMAMRRMREAALKNNVSKHTQQISSLKVHPRPNLESNVLHTVLKESED